MPMLSDIRDAGSVEQDADIVLFLHRPIKANPSSLGPGGRTTPSARWPRRATARQA